jgi:hypothetical protein
MLLIVRPIFPPRQARGLAVIRRIVADDRLFLGAAFFVDAPASSG